MSSAALTLFYDCTDCTALRALHFFLQRTQANDFDVKKPPDNSIVLKNVHFSYHKDNEGESLPPASHSVAPTPPSPRGSTPKTSEILHGISMTLPQGTYTVFVGPSGSGIYAKFIDSRKKPLSWEL